MIKNQKELKALLTEHADFLNNDRYNKLSGNKRDVMAVLIENYLMESTVTGDIDKYDPLLSPMIRRTVPNLIAFEIFGVQPMRTSTGLAVCMRPVHQNSAANPVKRANSKVLILADGTAFASAGTAISGEGSGVGVVRYAEGNKLLVEITSGSFTVGQNVDDASSYSAAVTTVSAVYDNEAGFQYLFKDYGSFASVALAETAGTDTKELGLVIDKVTVTAESLKLKAQYTDELMQDIRSQYGLDVDAELSTILSNEVTNELNQKFLDLLRTRAATGGTSTFNFNSITYGGDADGRWFAEKMLSFYHHINTVGNNIFKTTLMGGGNFFVTSMDVVSGFESLKQWVPASQMGLTSDIGSTSFAGMLGRYKVYQDMYQDDNSVYIGYKGPSEWMTGIVYCPYVPLYIKKGMGPDDGNNRMFLNTRFGIGENPYGAHNFYRKMTVSNF